MKKLTFLFSVFLTILFSHISFAQIRNGSFENWPDMERADPGDWDTYDEYYQDAVTLSADAFDGSNAARLEVLDNGGSPFQPFLVSWEDGGGHPVSERYPNVTGYYKFHNEGNDKFKVSVEMFVGFNPVGAGEAFFDATSEYTPFNVPINYTGSETPSNAVVTFSIADPETWIATIGSWALVDLVELGGQIPVGIKLQEATLPRKFNLRQNYPNPFNPTTRIELSLPFSGEVSLKVYDILGQDVGTLVSEGLGPGSYTYEWDAEGLASGVYIYQLRAGEFIETRRMVLMR